MNIQRTRINSATNGVIVRKQAVKVARTSKAAAQVGIAAVSGFLSGLFSGQVAPVKRAVKRRK